MIFQTDGQFLLYMSPVVSLLHYFTVIDVDSPDGPLKITEFSFFSHPTTKTIATNTSNVSFFILHLFFHSNIYNSRPRLGGASQNQRG